MACCRRLRWVMTYNCYCCLVAQLSDYFGIPGTVTHQAPLSKGISQSRTLEWVAISFSRGSSTLRDWTHVSCIGRQILYLWATRGALVTYWVGCKREAGEAERDLPGDWGSPKEASHSPKVRVRLWTWAAAGGTFRRVVAIFWSHQRRKQDQRRSWTTAFGKQNCFGHKTDISV